MRGVGEGRTVKGGGGLDGCVEGEGWMAAWKGWVAHSPSAGAVRDRHPRAWPSSPCVLFVARATKTILTQLNSKLTGLPEKKGNEVAEKSLSAFGVFWLGRRPQQPPLLAGTTLVPAHQACVCRTAVTVASWPTGREERGERRPPLPPRALASSVSWCSELR
jgi:hypothetical protein